MRQNSPKKKTHPSRNNDEAFLRQSSSPAPSRTCSRALPLPNSYDLFPSSIVCSCGERFCSDWCTDDDKPHHESERSFVGSALWLFLRHKSSVLADPSGLARSHQVAFVIMSCVECSISVDIDDYKEHLESAHDIDCRRPPPPSRALDSRRCLAAPYLQCAACREKGEALDVIGALAHSHGEQQQRFDLQLICRACNCRVPIVHAIGHAALWHPERLQRSSSDSAALADLFVTAPTMRPIPAGVDAIYPISDRFYESKASGLSLKAKKSVVNVNAPSLPLSTDDDSDDNAIPPDQATESPQLSPDSVQPAAGNEEATSDRGGEVISQQESAEPPPVGVSETIGESGEIVRTFDNLAIVHISKYRCLPVPAEGERHDSTSLMVARMERPRGSLSNECELCGQRFAMAAHLSRHLWRHTGVRRYGCHHCRQRFVFQGHVARHVETMHVGGPRRFECDECGKRFKRNEALVHHGVTHTGKDVWQCPLCPRSFRYANVLKRHKRAVHEGIGPRSAPYGRDRRARTCPVCSIEFENVAELLLHGAREQHAVERFTCARCGRTFCRRSSLRSHVREHTGEFFRCRRCGNDFAKKSEQRRHMLQCGIRDV